MAHSVIVKDICICDDRYPRSILSCCVDDEQSWRKSNDPLFPVWPVVVSQMWENMSLRDGHDLSEVFKDPRAPRHCKNKIMVCFDLYSTQCNNSSQG